MRTVNIYNLRRESLTGPTSHRHAHGFAMLVGDCNVYVRRQIAAIQFWDEVLVHIERVGVDIQLMTDFRLAWVHLHMGVC